MAQYDRLFRENEEHLLKSSNEFSCKCEFRGLKQNGE